MLFVIFWNAFQALQPAAEAEIVTARRPPTTTSHSYESEFLDALPIHGHAYQDALSLAPGVSDPDADGRATIHGARESETAFRLDGAEFTDPLEGSFGMNLNPYMIESLEVTTAGAPASMGRALGGFVDITTRSGGNDLAGKLGLFWQDTFLDGRGADYEDIVDAHVDHQPFHDFRAAGRLGGAFVDDRLWWFTSLEAIDAETPAGPGPTYPMIDSRALYAFGKLSWQADAANKLVLQAAADPTIIEGLGLGISSDPDSGYTHDRQALNVKLGWTSMLSDRALLEVTLSRYDQSIEIDPDSADFAALNVGLGIGPGGGQVAFYPCEVANCSQTLGDDPLSRYTATTGRISGPFYLRASDGRSRDALRADVSGVLSPRHGTHSLSAGFEIGQEKVEQDVLINPILYDYSSLLIFPSGQTRLQGYQLLQVSSPARTAPDATTWSSSFYVSDSFKPRSNLSITVGVRLDAEEIDFPGYQPFDVVRERRRSVDLWEAVCAEAVRQGTVFNFSVCNPLVPYNGAPPFDARFDTFFDADGDGSNDVDPELVALDLDGDGTFFGPQEGESLYKHFTRYEDREPGGFTIDDGSVSPRVGVSWDPWGAGRTKFFAHWGRYHDRLDPEAVLSESSPDTFTFLFTAGASGQILPGAPSQAGSMASMRRVDHDLQAPWMDELSLGGEVSLGSAWRAGLTFVSRRAEDLLQDVDQNHYTCGQAGIVGIDPAALCGDPNGVLRLDRFGNPTFGPQPSGGPNGLVDLYTASPMYGSVLVVENADGIDVTSWEVSAVRSMNHNWQMRAGYTLSRARGEASGTFAAARDDVSVTADQRDWLEHDERHSLEAQAVWRLPAEVMLGGMLRWDSGLPYTVYEAPEADLDSSGNSSVRQVLPTGEAFDQRNEGRWRLDARLEKGFQIGKARASGFFSAQNLLDDDWLVVTSYTQGGYVTTFRDLGRRFEIGSTFSF
ncbi:MAG: TonB-dependent receptor plug domain-containing protein [Candidatus Polarisedimenticolia bacterium]